MDAIKLEPYTYIHILDLNTNLTRLEEGPKTLYRLDHEEIVLSSTKMVKLPPAHYVVIGNPVVLDAHKKVVVNPNGTLKNQYGEQAIKTSDEFPDPFPLYPGEVLISEPKKYVVAGKDESIQIEVKRDYTDSAKVKRYAGQIYQIRGPITYVPRVEESYLKTIKGETITKNQGLILKANLNFKDKKGTLRYSGETTLYTEVGSYIPEAEESVVKKVKGVVLDSKKALHLEALREFVDVFGQKRLPGEQWIITNEQIQTYIEGVNERIVAEIKPITLTSREYCTIENPYKDGKPQWGKEEIRIGERTFFLQPNEKLIGSIEKIQILDENDALILEATEDFFDSEFKVHRRARENWMVKGPREYIPHVSTMIKKARRALALDSNEGVYIRDLVSGKVHAVIGEKVLLKDTEEFWDKELEPLVEKIIYGAKAISRNKSDIVTYPVADNSVVQIFDYKTRKTRCVFGPEMVLLQPSEEFTLLKLSGGIPKKECQEPAISIPLGQINFEDQIIVETNDHASIIMQLCYSGQFVFNKEGGDPNKMFSIQDFIGIAAKTIASRIRGIVSSVEYNEFHHNYSNIVKQAVFGKNGYYLFPENDFKVMECDVKSQSIKDEEIREKLKNNTSMAIELKTKANELKYELQRKTIEEESKGKLVLQKLKDETRAADAQINLQRLKAQSDAIKEVGEKIAAAKAQSEGSRIKGDAVKSQAEFNASAYDIETEMIISGLQMQNAEIFDKQRETDEMLVDKTRKTSEIETQKFKQLVGAIGRETILAMSKSGPENRAKLLKGLGLEGYLVTDGKTPINLFSAANGLVSQSRPGVG